MADDMADDEDDVAREIALLEQLSAARDMEEAALLAELQLQCDAHIEQQMRCDAAMAAASATERDAAALELELASARARATAALHCDDACADVIDPALRARVEELKAEFSVVEAVSASGQDAAAENDEEYARLCAQADTRRAQVDKLGVGLRPSSLSHSARGGADDEDEDDEDGPYGGASSRCDASKSEELETLERGKLEKGNAGVGSKRAAEPSAPSNEEPPTTTTPTSTSQADVEIAGYPYARFETVERAAAALEVDARTLHLLATDPCADHTADSARAVVEVLEWQAYSLIHGWTANRSHMPPPLRQLPHCAVPSLRGSLAPPPAGRGADQADQASRADRADQPHAHAESADRADHAVFASAPTAATAADRNDEDGSGGGAASANHSNSSSGGSSSSSSSSSSNARAAQGHEYSDDAPGAPASCAAFELAVCASTNPMTNPMAPAAERGGDSEQQQRAPSSYSLSTTFASLSAAASASIDGLGATAASAFTFTDPSATYMVELDTASPGPGREWLGGWAKITQTQTRPSRLRSSPESDTVASTAASTAAPDAPNARNVHNSRDKGCDPVDDADEEGWCYGPSVEALVALVRAHAAHAPTAAGGGPGADSDAEGDADSMVLANLDSAFDGLLAGQAATHGDERSDSFRAQCQRQVPNTPNDGRHEEGVVGEGDGAADGDGADDGNVGSAEAKEATGAGSDATRATRATHAAHEAHAAHAKPPPPPPSPPLPRGRPSRRRSRVLRCRRWGRATLLSEVMPS